MERTFSASDYRYGYNGKEKDDEVSGSGNSYDYGFRIYNPRLGKFLSVDPLSPEYPWYTPYQFAGNKPIFAIDLDGLEEKPATQLSNGGHTTAQASTSVKTLTEKDIKNRISPSPTLEVRVKILREIQRRILIETVKIMNGEKLAQVLFAIASGNVGITISSNEKLGTQNSADATKAQPGMKLVDIQLETLELLDEVLGRTYKGKNPTDPETTKNKMNEEATKQRNTGQKTNSSDERTKDVAQGFGQVNNSSNEEPPKDSLNIIAKDGGSGELILVRWPKGEGMKVGDNGNARVYSNISTYDPDKDPTKNK